MDDTFDSQGTELYLSLDGTTVVAFDCPTGITGLGITSEERDRGCLNETVGASRPGRRRLTAVTVPFRVVKGSEAHQWLMGLLDPAEPSVEVPFAIGWSDGTADPALASGAFVAPGTGPAWTRTVTAGTAYVSAVNFDFADGQDVIGSFTFMPQSATTTWKP